MVGLNAIVRNNYSVAFVVEPGASTNQVENRFSRPRRAEIRIHYRIASKYLDWYAADVAWREEFRHVDFRAQSNIVLAPRWPSRSAGTWWVTGALLAGYGRRRGKAKEALVDCSPLNPLQG